MMRMQRRRLVREKGTEPNKYHAWTHYYRWRRSAYFRTALSGFGLERATS